VKKKKALLITGISVGALLALGPLWGVIGTVFGMLRAFCLIQESAANPNEMATGIGLALSLTTIGLIACPIGVVTIIFCAWALHKLHK
jgi:biopolymer transport protein ExbB/TolQ